MYIFKFQLLSSPLKIALTVITLPLFTDIILVYY
nr:MAG TPA: hypothetical protein [Caudoviricetes sp.]